MTRRLAVGSTTVSRQESASGVGSVREGLWPPGRKTLSEELTPVWAWDGQHPERRECHFASWNGTAPVPAGARRIHIGGAK